MRKVGSRAAASSILASLRRPCSLPRSSGISLARRCWAIWLQRSARSDPSNSHIAHAKLVGP
eukprot:3103815-Pyramimonas_sp.AAC.1